MIGKGWAQGVGFWRATPSYAYIFPRKPSAVSHEVISGELLLSSYLPFPFEGGISALTRTIVRTL